MKSALIVLILCLPPVAALAAETGQPAKKPAGVVVQKAEKAGTLQRLLDEMWAKLRTYAPKLNTSDSRTPTVVVVGVRGAESTGTQLKPYWKDDRSADPAYAQELSAFNDAQAAADAGDSKKAVAQFDAFLKTYPQSKLRSNAQFGLGLAFAGAGDRQRSREALNTFVQEYGSHPLAPEARRLIAALSGS